MEYCARCCYPANAKPTIIFDDEGVCSGCRYHESRDRIDWQEREKMLKELYAAGVVDADYRGEVRVLLFNFGKEDFKVEYGDRIA